MEEMTIKEVTIKVVECLRESTSPTGISAVEISEKKRLYVQKVYDVLSVLNTFPNDVTPLITKNGRNYIMKKSCMDDIDRKIVSELQQARILIKKLKIISEYMESIDKSRTFKMDELTKRLEYIEIDLPQSYVF